jgi:peptidoglycan/LPS O-acetylase OafA/YrhL
MPKHANEITRIPALDGIRGFAILLVLVFHLIGDREYIGNAWVDGVLSIAKACWIGVDLFFVLSGFLITSILLRAKEGKGWLWNFYARRALRILPLYYLWVGLYIFVVPALLPVVYDGKGGPDFILWLHLADFKGHSPAATHLWSLAIEEQFYLVWPILVARFSNLSLLRVVAVALVGSLMLRGLILAGFLPLHPIKVYVLPFTHCDGLLIGSALALLRRTSCLQRIQKFSFALLASGGSLLIILFVAGGGPSFWQNPAIALVGYPTVAFCFGVLVLLALRDDRLFKGIFSCGLLLVLGKFSYFIYLFHVPIVILAKKHLKLEPWLLSKGVPVLAAWLFEFLLLTGITLIGAVISWRLFEGPILRLKSRFPQQPSPCKGNDHLPVES